MDPLTKAYRTAAIFTALAFVVGGSFGFWVGEKKATASVRFEFLPCWSEN